MRLTANEGAARRLVGDALRYVLVAGLVTLFYLGVYGVLLAVGMQYFLAILCAQAVTVAAAFPTYRRFVFGPGSSAIRDFVRFLGVWVGGAIAGLVVTPLSVELLNWNPFFGQVVAIAVVTVANFVIHRFWTFAPGRAPGEHGENPDAT